MQLPIDSTVVEPWAWGLTVVLGALSVFIIKITPSIVQIITSLGNKDAEKDILDTVKEIREQQKTRYIQQDAYQSKTDARLNDLEDGVVNLQRDLSEIKSKCSWEEK